MARIITQQLLTEFPLMAPDVCAEWTSGAWVVLYVCPSPVDKSPHNITQHSDYFA